MKTAKKYYIKERNNYQSIYYCAEGQLSKAAAKRMENSIHGINVMHAFDTEEAYNARLAYLRKKGERVLT